MLKRNLALALVIFLGLSGVGVHADTFTATSARNQRGEEAHPLYAGYAATRIASAGLAGEELVCSGRCLLAGLIPTTGTTGGLMYVFDTAVAANAAIGGPRVKLSSNFWTVETGSPINRVPLPIRFTNGISVRLTSIAAGEAVTVLYLDMDP